MTDHAPPYIPNLKSWIELENPGPRKHPHTGEEMGFTAEFGRTFGFGRIGFRHHRLMPGQRASMPHAEGDEEEFVFILEGTPDLWADGYLVRLKIGDAVGWPNGTGHAHTILNNTNKPVRMIVIGEASRYASRIVFPVDKAGNDWLIRHDKLWKGAPTAKLGPHDGLTDVMRGAPTPKGSKTTKRPPYVVHWTDIQGKDNNTYPGDKEKLAVGSHLSGHTGIRRIGIWLDELKPGRRTSWPHAERDEEEFVYVVEGDPDIWINGHIYRATAGDCVGWINGTGQAHTVINNTKSSVRLIVAGEASRKNAGIWYPLHPKRNKQLKDRLWTDVPKHKMGPHDGKPDALRAKATKKR
jgi:uncharacterized cupin superfamily protein